MGVVRHILAQGEYDGNGLPYTGRLVIEDNVSETVHLHIGHLRMEFTPEQFMWFADLVAEAGSAIRALRD